MRSAEGGLRGGKMFKLIKWLIVLGIIAGIALWVTGYKVRGKTIEEHLKPILEQKMVKEGIHDVRSIVGEGLKAAGEAVSEDVTDSERKQLDNLVKQELEKGKPIPGAPGQQALPPVAQPAPAAVPQAAPQPSVQQPLQAAPAPQAAPSAAAPAAPAPQQ